MKRKCSLALMVFLCLASQLFTFCKKDPEVISCPNCPIIISVSPQEGIVGEVGIVNGNFNNIEDAQDVQVFVGGVEQIIIDSPRDSMIQFEVVEGTISGHVSVCWQNPNSVRNNTLCSDYVSKDSIFFEVLPTCEKNPWDTVILEPKANHKTFKSTNFIWTYHEVNGFIWLRPFNQDGPLDEISTNLAVGEYKIQFSTPTKNNSMILAGVIGNTNLPFMLELSEDGSTMRNERYDELNEFNDIDQGNNLEIKQVLATDDNQYILIGEVDNEGVFMLKTDEKLKVIDSGWKTGIYDGRFYPKEILQQYYPSNEYSIPFLIATNSHYLLVAPNTAILLNFSGGFINPPNTTGDYPDFKVRASFTNESGNILVFGDGGEVAPINIWGEMGYNPTSYPELYRTKEVIEETLGRGIIALGNTNNPSGPELDQRLSIVITTKDGGGAHIDPSILDVSHLGDDQRSAWPGAIYPTGRGGYFIVAFTKDSDGKFYDWFIRTDCNGRLEN